MLIVYTQCIRAPNAPWLDLSRQAFSLLVSAASILPASQTSHLSSQLPSDARIIFQFKVVLHSCRAQCADMYGETNSTERCVTFDLPCKVTSSQTLKKINLTIWEGDSAGHLNLNLRWWLRGTLCTLSRSSTLVRSGYSGLRETDGLSMRMLFLFPFIHLKEHFW